MYRLASGNGLEVDFIAYGGTITAIRMPDRHGAVHNIVLGFANPEDYAKDFPGGRPYFGALIGRYANRIANARFSLQGQTYHLAANEGANILHGGPNGFDRQLWQVEQGQRGAVLRHTSPAGTNGFPGALRVEVHYCVTSGNALHITYLAQTDAPTVLNLTNHSYFNLAGEGSFDVGEHLVRLDADHYLPVDASQLPIAAPAPVKGTSFDLRRPTRLAPSFTSTDPQLAQTKGFDQSWLLRGAVAQDGTRHAATIYEDSSGRWVACHTTQPAVQFYTGNNLDGTLTGPSGRPYRRHAGFALETQHFPDSPNHPHFPSCALLPGDLFSQTTIFRFGVANSFPDR